MKQLTTDDLRNILSGLATDFKYKGQSIKDLDDAKVVEAFSFAFRLAFQHANSRHYTSIMDEPRY